MSDNNQVPKNPMEHEIPIVENPGFEVPPQPVQFEQPEYSQTTNYQPQYQQPVQYNNTSVSAPKKKSKKKLAGVIAAVVGVAACACVAVFAGPQIIAALSNKSNLAPIDRFKNAITEVSEDLTDKITDSAKESNIKQDNMQANITFDVTFGEYITAMLPAEYSSLTNLGGTINVISKDDNQYFDLALLAKDNQLVSMKGYLDQLSNKILLTIPELSPNYLSADLENYLPDSSSLTSDEAMSNKELAKFITEETDIFLSSVKTVELEEDVEVDAGDVSAKYDKLTTTIEGQQLVDVVSNLAKRFIEDQNFSKLISQYSTDDLFEEIKSWEADDSDKITIDLYVDSDDKIAGFVLTPESDGEAVELGCLTAEDDETGFEVYALVENEKVLTLEGSYTEKSDEYTGKATLSVNSNGTNTSFDLAFEDVSYGASKLKGTFSLSSPELMGATIKCAIDYEKEKLNATLDVLMASTPLISATITATASEADSCPTAPTDVIVYDSETEAEDYLETADMVGLFQGIQDATGIDFSSLIESMYGY